MVSRPTSNDELHRYNALLRWRPSPGLRESARELLDRLDRLKRPSAGQSSAAAGLRAMLECEDEAKGSADGE